MAFCGIARLRFVVPTYIGNTIRVRLTVTGLLEKGPGGVVACDPRITKDAEKPVAVGTIRVLVAKSSGPLGLGYGTSGDAGY
ncbi:hypothetical protein TPY_1995 [Sulfobacillus acidophilus TPY]|nr:hypothetical protein TPY_1995 [Sulfobacillus acidophilus TPY]